MKIRILLMAVAVAMLASCEHDGYESGDGSLSYLTAELAVLHTASNRSATSADLDNGTTLSISTPFTTSWMAKADTVYRALLYYDVATDGSKTVKARSVSAVPVLRPIDQNKVTEMHTDPVGVESAWAAKSGYINLSLLLKAGKTDGEDAVQTLGLVDCGTTEGDDGKRMRHLKLYHDQGGVPEYYTVQRYASIDIKDLGDADVVSITVNTYGGEVTKTFDCNK